MFKFNFKIVKFMLLLVFPTFLYAHDLSLKIPTASINNLFQSFIEAGIIPIIDQTTQSSSFKYKLTPSSLILELPQEGPLNTFKLTLNEGLYAELSNNWTIVPEGPNGVHVEFVIVGQVFLLPQGIGYKILFTPEAAQCSISPKFANFWDAALYVATDPGIQFQAYLDSQISYFLSQLPELSTTSQISLLPSIALEYFTSTTPTLSTTANEIILGLTVNNLTHYVNAYNEVNQNRRVGNIEEVIGGVVTNTETSPRIFTWTPNTTHQIQTDTPVLDVSAIKYKYKNWFDTKKALPETDIAPRRISISFGGTEDLSFKALFNRAQHVQLSNILEGNLISGTVTYEATTVSSFDDYDFFDPSLPHPINTSVPNGTLGTNWLWQGWSDGNANQSRNIILNSDVNLTAKYKGHLRSNSSSGFSNYSQRKIFAEPFTSNRYLVYESQGYIWYSKSTDNGATWSPEIKMSEEGAQAKGASIVVSNGYTYILYQSDHDTYNNNLPTLILRKVSSNGSVLGKREVYPLGNPSAYSYNTMAVLTAYLNHILVVFKPNAATGLLGREFHDDNYKFASCPFNVLIFSETTQYSVNPSIAVKYVLPNRRYMLAYQESYGTIYCKEWDIATDLNNLTTTNLTTGSPYFLNRYPSIVSFGTGAKVCWIGGSASQYSAAVIRDVDPGSTQFWSFGFYASSPSITATDNNSAYFLGWKENGTGFKIVDNHLSNTYMKTLTGLQGNAIQLSSGINADVMYAMTYNNTVQPFYTLTPSKSLGYYYRVQASLSKENAISNIASGRAGVVIKDAAQFFFMLGDIEVNGEKIRFKQLSDTLKIPSMHVFNTLVESEPFELKANSSFTYSVEYGVTDSSLAAQVLQNDEHVKFKVEVVVASSGQIVGTLDPVSYTRNFLQSYSSIDYQVSTEAIRTMNVKLRLIVDHSGDASYSITNRFYDEDVTLAKKGAKVINLNEDLQIKEYALAQNYPNPFNPATTITYQLPKSGSVTLKIFDILGNEVKTLVNENKEMGRYTVQFDASSLASGMYVYQLRANDYTSTRKMMLLK